MEACGHQARGVRDVGHEGGPRLVGDLAERLEVDGAGEGRATRDDELRAVLLGQVSHLVEIDPLRVPGDAVRHDGVEPPREVHGASRREMAAVGEIGPKDHISRLEQGEVHRHVRL